MDLTVRRPLMALLVTALLAGGATPSPAAGATEEPAERTVTRVAAGESMLLSKRYVGEDDEYHYQLWLRDGASGTEQAVVTDPFTKPFHADLSPDGRAVAYTVGAGSTLPASGLFVVGADGSGRRNLLAGTKRINTAREPEWSPDGQRLVFTAIDKDFTDDLWTVRSDGTGLTRLTDCDCTRYAAPTWSPDGDHVLYSTDIYDLAVLDLETRQSRPLDTGRTVNTYTWSPDGEDVVFSAVEAWNSVRQVLWSMPASGGSPRVVVEQDGMTLSSPHFSPDGQHLGFVQREVSTDPGDAEPLLQVAWVRADGSAPHTVGILGGTSYVVDLLAWGRDCGCAPGGRFSSVSVRVKTMSNHLQVAGGLLPGLHDAPVKVVVQRKKGRSWKPLQTLTARTSELSTYYASTRRAAGQLCRVTVSWTGDAQHAAARTRTKALAC